MVVRRLAKLCLLPLVVVPLGAWAPRYNPATRGGALPVSAESALAASFPCLGRLIDASNGPPVLITIRNFDDGTVPTSQNGPLNDRNYLLGLAAVSNLRSTKVMVTTEGPDREIAIKSLEGRKDVLLVTLDGSYTAYDQRTLDKSKGVDFFLFAVQGTASKDLSYSSIHFTGVLQANGMALSGGAFRHKAVLENRGSRYNISLFTDKADIGATFAKSSFQAIGDLEALLADLAVMTAVSRIYSINLSTCLNAPDGQDYGATAGALFDQLPRQALQDRITAGLFRLGYLRHPTLTYDTSVSRAAREFQDHYGLPPDGLPNQATFVTLGRAEQGREVRAGGADPLDRQLGLALETGRTGSIVSWRMGAMSGQVEISQTWDNYQRQGRTCRAFLHTVEIDRQRYQQPERIACRLDRDVWAPLP